MFYLAASPPVRPAHSYWTRLHLAAALADDPWEVAVLLDENKKKCGRLPIPDAAALVETTAESLRHAAQDIADDGHPAFLAANERARTVVIRAGKDVLSIDGDDRADVEKILTLYRALRAAGHLTIMLASGRSPETPNPTRGGPNPFGLHLWAWGLPPDQLNHFQGVARDLGLRRSPFLRAPWSPHPSGTAMRAFSDPEDHLDCTQQVAALALLEQRGRGRLHGDQEGDGAQEGRADVLPGPTAPTPTLGVPHDPFPRPIPEKWQRLLREGAPAGRRSAEIGRFLMGAANAGWTWPMVWEALTNRANGLSARVRERPGDRRRWLETEWDKASQKVAQSPPVRSRAAVLDLIDGLIAAALARPLKVASHQLAYEHHLAVAKRLGTLEYRLDVRTLAQETGYSIKTMSYANDALIELGRLRRLETGNRNQATKWSVEPRGNNHYPRRGELIVSSRFSASHDLWRHRLGLGKARFKVYRLLDGVRAVTDKQIAAALVYASPKTAGHHLRVLERYGLAERVVGGWWRGPADPDFVAMKLGVSGKGVRQREQHQHQREEYHRQLRNVVCPDCGEMRQGIPRRNGTPSRCRECRARRPSTGRPNAYGRRVMSRAPSEEADMARETPGANPSHEKIR